jgi:hypothetical protein
MALFTSTEKAALVNSTDTGIKLLLLQAAGNSGVTLTDAATVNGLAYLVSLGILTTARQMAISANQPPG